MFVLPLVTTKIIAGPGDGVLRVTLKDKDQVSPNTITGKKGGAHSAPKTGENW